MRIDFDHPDASGGPTVTSSIDFDTMSAAEIADTLKLDPQTGARLHALTAAMVGTAHDQATLNKLVATGAAMALKAIQSGTGLGALRSTLAAVGVPV